MSYVDIQSVLRAVPLAPAYTALQGCAKAVAPEVEPFLAKSTLFRQQDSESMRADREVLEKYIVEVGVLHHNCILVSLVYMCLGRKDI